MARRFLQNCLRIYVRIYKIYGAARIRIPFGSRRDGRRDGGETPQIDSGHGLRPRLEWRRTLRVRLLMLVGAAGGLGGGLLLFIGLSGLQFGTWPLRREFVWLILGLLFALGGTILGLLALVFLSVVRPLRELERSASALCRGELQRPIPLSSTATAELRALQLAWEELRRALISKLRSSTELNLQLESEVARRSAELSRRNAELSEALLRLHATRDELLRTEKLAAVGRIAATLTSAIYTPVSSVAAGVVTLQATLTAAFGELEQLAHDVAPAKEIPGTPGIDGEAAAKERLRTAFRARLRVWLEEVDDMLERLLRSAMRVRDIVRAMRVYARPQPQPESSLLPPLVKDAQGKAEESAEEAKKDLGAEAGLADPA